MRSGRCPWPCRTAGVCSGCGRGDIPPAVQGRRVGSQDQSHHTGGDHTGLYHTEAKALGVAHTGSHTAVPVGLPEAPSGLPPRHGAAGLRNRLSAQETQAWGERSPERLSLPDWTPRGGPGSSSHIAPIYGGAALPFSDLSPQPSTDLFASQLPRGRPVPRPPHLSHVRDAVLWLQKPERFPLCHHIVL